MFSRFKACRTVTAGFSGELASEYGNLVGTGQIHVPQLRRLVASAGMGSPVLCCGLRLGVQCEEAHHVVSDREPQQMDASLDLAAQA